jgi:Protein of unknown function (DUF4242)
MSKFIVELYATRGDDAAIARGVELARRAAERLTSEGTPVRHLRSIFVPEDETCICLFEAEDGEAAQEAARAAGLPFERDVTAVAEMT